MSADLDHFYANLPANKIPLSKLLTSAQLFKAVPEDWFVIITDIKNSTAAVSGGLHENVNFVATGSIVTVLNIAFKAGITIPFFFGGDGATFLIPKSIKDKTMNALLLYKANTLQNYNLDLRAGIISVKEIYAKGLDLQISKFSSIGVFSIPVVLGQGLNYAEQIIKADDYLSTEGNTNTDELDLSGMQCRWDKIAPPENTEEIVTLIVIEQKNIDQSVVFSQVISHIDEIYGTQEARQPISIPKLIFKTSFNNLGQEMRTRLGKVNFFELVKTWFTNLYGYIYFRTQSGKNYLNKLVEMSDTLVIDGRINTVISGTEQQRLALQSALNAMEDANKILYALYVSKESVMSCYVRDLEDDHIHFVDGSEGGYTKAASILKNKLKIKA
jgi:hypothetical protein